MSDRVLNIRDLPTRRWGPVTTKMLAADVMRVDRRTPWGNPFVVGTWPPDQPARITRRLAIELFRAYAVDRLVREPAWLDPLIGKRLACWCAPSACHADVLIELVDVVTAARAVMAAHVVSWWLTTPVPLLEGLTPRDVIAVVRAGEVVALLRSLGEGVLV